MRIAIFCNDFWPTIGGVQTGVWGLARALERRGHAALVLTRQLPGTPAVERVNGIEVRRFQWNLRPRATFPVRLLRAGFAVLSVVRPWRPDIVLAHFVTVHALYAYACAQRSGVPLMLSFRGEDARRIAVRSAINRLVYRVLVRAADVNLFCSAWLRDETTHARWFRGGRSRTAILADAVEVNHREPPPSGTNPYVVTAGRFVSKKGFDLLLRAWAAVHADLSATLYVAGDGPEEASLKALAVSLGLERSVKFLGPVPHARLLGLLAGASLCVVPSREEPYGIIVVEAQALGVPVLASAVGNIPRLIDHGVTGYLVDPSVAGLSRGLVAAWSDPRRTQVGAAGRTTAGATRTYDVMAGELIDYAMAARQRSGRGGGRV